jgi:uncharacterized membrane protein
MSFAALRSLAARAWQRWTVIARVIGNFQARVLLSLFYFVVVPPFALLVKLAKDPLRLRLAAGATAWTERPVAAPPSETARRQY